MFSQTKIVLLEVGYIEKWPKFTYLKSKVPHLKFQVMQDRVYRKLVSDAKRYHLDKFSLFKITADRLDSFLFEVLQNKNES